MFKIRFGTRFFETAGITAICAVVSFMIAVVFGWCANIIQIVTGFPPSFAEMTPLFVLKCIGVFFAPLGSTLGLYGLF